MNTKRNNMFLIAGIIGTVFVGYGDWLLGYVAPDVIGTSSLLCVGHGMDYALWKPIASMLTGIIGMLLYVPFFMEVSKTITNDRTRKAFSISASCGFLGYLLIHYYVASLVFQYSWGVKNAVENAFEYTSAVLEAFSPVIMILYAIVIIPFIIHFWATIKGKTNLPKLSVVANPLCVLIFLALIVSCLPDSKFASGLKMGIASEAIFTWAIVLFLMTKKKIPLKNK